MSAYVAVICSDVDFISHKHLEFISYHFLKFALELVQFPSSLLLRFEQSAYAMTKRTWAVSGSAS
jgi:hypothetical protein